MIDWRAVIELAVAAIAGGAGLLLLFRSLPRIFRANPEERWQRVQGTITSTHIDVSSGDGTSYRPCVEYTFRYLEQEFTGDCIAPLERTFNSRGSAESVLTGSGFARGEPVTVFVNPQDPRESVLKPGSQNLAAVWYSLAGALCIIWAYSLAARHWTPD